MSTQPCTSSNVGGLTHAAGHEWLKAVESDQRRCHAAEEKSVDAKVTGDAAVLVGRSIVKATIYGAHGTWNLQLTTNHRRNADGWLAVATVATTF